MEQFSFYLYYNNVTINDYMIMATIKSYSDLQQSKKLAEILPIESADMTLPFRHPKNDEYIPGYVVSRNYVEAYNEIMKLPAMEKEDVCKLIQPSWSLAALLDIIPEPDLVQNSEGTWLIRSWGTGYPWSVGGYSNPVDACVAMIEKLHELKML